MIIYSLTFFIILYLATQSRLSPKWRLLLKMCASLSFLSIGIYRYFLNPETVSICILSGLTLGVLGDLFLGLRHVKNTKLAFILGTAFFFLGHMAYLLAFHMFTTIDWPVVIPISLFVLLSFYGYHRKANFDFGNNIITCYLYLFILALVVVTGIWELNTIDAFSLTLLSVGVFLFAISDTFLSAIYFKKLSRKRKKLYQIISPIFYYSAQLLITLAI